jgi:hypothetical protein
MRIMQNSSAKSRQLRQEQTLRSKANRVSMAPSMATFGFLFGEIALHRHRRAFAASEPASKGMVWQNHLAIQW